MDNQTFYKRTVKFRDADKNLFIIDIHLERKEARDARHYETLEPVTEVIQFSASGSCGSSCGQVDGHIKPRTVGQKRLLKMWADYHLNDFRAGTKAQSDYINSAQYPKDYNAFVSLFSNYNDDLRSQFDAVSFSLLQQKFGSDCDYASLRTVIAEQMDGQPIKYILGLKNKKWYSGSPHGLHDLYTRWFFLALRGLLFDKGYKYGRAWLVNPLPDDIQRQVDDLCNLIEEEEAALTEELEAVFDMGAEGFKATEEYINKVIELRDCDEDEAKRFLALGMCLGCTFGDLNDTFEETSDDNKYTANGVEYYIGTEDELNAVAKDYLDDGYYDDLWKEAVAADHTTKGLSDWLQEVIDTDGWCPVINTYDGSYDEYKVGNDWICVSRT